VSINVSRMQMRHADFAGRLGRCLAHHRLPASRLTCEITETAVIEDTVDSRVAFDSLRRLGVQVSVDDFGTGQSSLSALCTLPARELKLDRAFAAALVGNAGARIIVKAVVDMAHALELRVVAEGVETASQRDLMRQAGCDELQGFLFARPMTACALSDWARAHCSASHPATHDVAPQLAVACNDSDISRDAPASSGDDNDIGARRA
jgi:EAL domain-containing protein (putative c-di-GMP-specific phosphodiesterase class I)